MKNPRFKYRAAKSTKPPKAHQPPINKIININGVPSCGCCRRPWQFDESYHKGAAVPDCGCRPQDPSAEKPRIELRGWVTYDKFQGRAFWRTEPHMGAAGQYVADEMPDVSTAHGGPGAKWFFDTFWPGWAPENDGIPIIMHVAFTPPAITYTDKFAIKTRFVLVQPVHIA